MANLKIAQSGESDETPFHNLDQYLAIPRLGGLTLSPDGTRLVTGIAVLNEERTKFRTSLWELDPAGHAEPRRLTRTGAESAPVFTPSGDLLFISARPDPDRPDGDDGPADLWVLPSGGGEARVVARRPGGIDAAITPHGPLAAEVETIVVASETLPSATDVASEAKLREARKKASVKAILHDSYPVRSWDHDLGPESPRLFAGELRAGSELITAPASPSSPSLPTASGQDRRDATPWDGGELTLRDLTPAPGRALESAASDVTPDGKTIVTTWKVPIAGGGQRPIVVAINVDDGTQTVLWDDPNLEFEAVVVSPDGRRAAVAYSTLSSAGRATRSGLGVIDLPADGAPASARFVATAWEDWPTGIAWLPDGRHLIVTADHDGRSPIFKVTLGSDAAADEVTRITSDDGAYMSVNVAPDGGTLFAVRSTYLEPPTPVRVPLDGSSYTVLRVPYSNPTVPGTIEDVETTASDGSRVRSWLVLPERASAQDPSPLLLWPHGGPLASWNAWSWRWNPWLLAVKGYAVLLPDPALSTGYGQNFIQRGWGAWGTTVYEDLMAATDAAMARPDIDETRVAAMGGSFGGYMVNWIAGHTDRFKAIVSHASLWAMDQFMPTTDGSDHWRHELTAEMIAANSPHHHVANIRTPMLVIHGDLDYRVPIGEGLRLWYELVSASQLAIDGEGRTPHRFLYFPDENHWVLSPQHSKVWYQVVYAFLAEHVLGEAEDLPAVLG